MSTCAIQPRYGKLGRAFKKNPNYWTLAQNFLNSTEEGYFFNPTEAAKEFSEIAGETPFLPNKFISAVNAVHNNTATHTKTDYFARDVADLFENAAEPMAYMFNNLEQKLIKASFIDIEADTITIDNSSLNANIQNYKNDLFKQVFDYVKKNNSAYKDLEFTPLYENKRFNPESNFEKLLTDLSEIFLKKQYTTNGKSVYNPAETAVLDVFNAGTILSNFDSLVEDRFKSILSVNQTNFGKLNNPLTAHHYFLEFKGMSTTYWKDSGHDEEGAERYASNFVKVIASTIPLLDIDGTVKPNQYLGMNGIYLLGALIKEHNEANPDDINFQDDPKASMVKFLRKLKKKGDLTYKAKIDSLLSYIKSVKDITEDALDANPSLMSDIIDIEAVIAHQINNVVAPTYGIYNTDGSKSLVNLVQRDLQGDEVRSQMLDTIQQNKNLFKSIAVNGDEVVTGVTVINKLKNPNKSVVKLLRDLTGVNITPSFLKILGMTNNAEGVDNYFGESFASLLKAGKEIATADKDAEKEELLAKLNTTKIVDIVTAGIASLAPEANMTFKSAEGNSIPTLKISNLAHEKKTVIAKAKEHFGGLSNLFINNKNLFKTTETSLEVVGEDGRATSALAMNPEEGFFQSFVHNYLTPMQKTDSEVEKEGNYLSFKLVNYSDKSTVLHEMVDQNADIDGLGSLKTMSLDTLKSTHKKYLNTFYSNIIGKVAYNYSMLVDKDGNRLIPELKNKKTREDYGKAIDIIDKFLVDNNKKLKGYIKDSWFYWNKQGVDISFTDEVMYSKYADGLRFNKSIKNYYLSTLSDVPSSVPDINDLAEQMFLTKLLEVDPQIPTLDYIFNKERGKNYITNLYNNLGLELADWVTFSSRQADKFVYFKYTDENGDVQSVHELNPELSEVKMDNVEINPLLAKWLHTQNMVRYNSLALSTKHEYQHPHKTGKAYDDVDWIEEMTGRSISMTKRMVIHPATMEYYQQGLIDGIPPKIKLAVMDDLSAISYNFTGDKQYHDAWDGSLSANPFLSYLLKRSFPAKGISDVQKAIGTSASDTHSTFLKCALFTFNNELIRKSLGSKINLDSLMKAMNNIDISDVNLGINSLNNNPINLQQLVPNGIYYKRAGRTFEVTRLTKTGNNNYKFLLADGETVTHEIKNLYDLWQAFGGAYSMSQEHGEHLDYSDASIDAVGSIISLAGGGILKDRMIGIVAQKSSVKNGATNLNDPNEFFKKDPKLMYSDFDTNFLGIQLDANHVSDESVVNEISQVISALAENQSTPELYTELYDAIGEIINSEIEKYNKEYKTEVGDFNLEQISKSFIEVLKKKEQSGNALEIVGLLEDVAAQSIPISNHNFFNGFVINVVSRLKTDFIKRKYPGIAAVLNPSHGMLQIYEDVEGNTYYYDDLLNIAEEQDTNLIGQELTQIQTLIDNLDKEADGYLDELEGLNMAFEGAESRLSKLSIHETNTRIVENVIQRLFPTRELKPEEYGIIKPLDTVRITDPTAEGSDKVQVYQLKDIEDYYTVKDLLANRDDLTVELITNKPRDLKPVEIAFTQAGVKKNIFDNDPVRLTWAYKRILNGGVVSDVDQQILQNFADYFAAKEGKESFLISDKAQQKFINAKLKLWNKRSFELLARQQNFVTATPETDFNVLFGTDDFVSKLPVNYSGNIIEISDYIHKPAEIIMPKLYRTEFNLATDSHNKINSEGSDYFAKKLNGVIDPLIQDVDLFVSSTKGDHTYISALTDEQIKEQGLTRKKIMTKRVDNALWRVDIKGNNIYKVPKGASIYEKDGIEVVVFNKKDNRYMKGIDTFVRQLDSHFMYPFAANDTENLEALGDIANRRNSQGINGLITPNFEETKAAVIENMAVSMFSSWKKSNDVMAARIPSQAMQSFMSMKNVGYIEDPGNNVYISHWQLWLQGSDFR